jgi:threonine aldolase
MHLIDLRSDTVTQPTPAMWEALGHAKVGDDVYGDDPTVNRLEEMAADWMGKPAAVFVASGTMGNLAAALAHCQRGDEAIMGDRSHSFLDEQGGFAALGGITSRTLPNQPDGTLRLEDIRAAIRMADIHYPITRLIVLENTQAECGGVPLTPEYTRQVGRIAREHGLKLHIDGARLFNAAVALGVEARELVEAADSVTFCLSKGLCAPIGSLLCGDEAFVARARRARKQLGGGMRQAGILAAAGMVALEQQVEHLAEDHRRARLLAEGLKALPAVRLQNDPPPTNMIFFTLDEAFPLDAARLVEQLKARGLLCNAEGARRIRLLTHYWITDEHVERALEIFSGLLRSAL